MSAQALFLIGGAMVAFGVFKGTEAMAGTASDSFTQWDELFKKYGVQYQVRWTWLKAIAMNESSLGKHPSVARGLKFPDDVEGSKSDDGKSWGIMQLTLPTARDFAPSTQVRDLNNPEYSIKVAAQFLAWLQNRFPTVDKRFAEWVIKSYNQGAGNTNKERAGTIKGYAGEYWARFQRNLAEIERKQGV